MKASRNPGWTPQPTAPCGLVLLFHFVSCSAQLFRKSPLSQYVKNISDLDVCHSHLVFFLMHSVFKSTATEMRPLRLRLVAEHRTICAQNHHQVGKVSSKFQMFSLRATSSLSCWARTDVHYIQCLTDSNPFSIILLKPVTEHYEILLDSINFVHRWQT